MNLKAFNFLSVLLFLSVSICGQNVTTGTVINLSSPVSGDHIFKADEHVKMTPNFSYQPGNGQSFKGHILGNDPNNPISTPMGPLTNSSGQTIPVDQSLTVGTILGKGGSSNSGGYNYSIPFIAPPGTNEMAPNIGLSYSSQAGNGDAGMGWNLTGEVE